VPQLKAFDDAMVNFMLARNIKSGTLAVMKDGKVMLERGYGWKNAGQTVAMPPNALLRIASITKPFTATAIHKLASEGKLSLSDRMFCLTGSPQPCHLLIQPWPAPIVFDLRLRDITIQHLLDHKGGWDSSASGDYMFMACGIADAMNIASPPSQHNLIRWVLGRPLNHTPGTTYVYSNFGYMLLGRIIA
jgi:CubicO group peptidase (beta-lactamase class C family)